MGRKGTRTWQRSDGEEESNEQVKQTYKAEEQNKENGIRWLYYLKVRGYKTDGERDWGKG